MSANIFQQAGTASMFSRGKPWHGLGQIVDKAQSIDEALKLAHLDWTVSKQELINPVTGKPSGIFATMRDDTNQALAPISKAYEIIQNRQGFELIDTLLEAQKGAHYESAGALGNGNQIWALASVPYNFEIAGDSIKRIFCSRPPMTAANRRRVS